MNDELITLQPATQQQSPHIARLIMQAMNHDCCRFFAGEDHTLTDFHRMMTALVEQEHSQYSYRHTLVALNTRQQVVGICVSYDGGELHRLREAFLIKAKEMLHRDLSGMDDETQAGELYIDSLAVDEHYQHRKIATRLLLATIEKARTMRLPAVGLLVDKGNPDAERLYRRVGFTFVNDSMWGGHPMRHLQIQL